MPLYRDNYRHYRQIGLIPLPATGKGPLVSWKEEDLYTLVSDDFALWEEKYADANIWVYLGDKFVVIDPDGPGAEEFVHSLVLPVGPTSLSGNKSKHRWFKASSPIKPIRVQMEDGSFLEIRTGRQGMLVPPSIHPDTAKPYQWVEGKAPWDITFPEFPLAIYREILALNGNGSEPSNNLPGWQEVYGKGVPAGMRNESLAKMVGYLITKGMAEKDLLLWARGWNMQNSPPMEDPEVERTVASVLRTHQRNHPEDVDDDMEIEQDEEGEEGAVQIDISTCLTDLGNSERFIRDHGADVRFCHLWNKWIVWDGRRWEVDNSGELSRRAKETVVRIYDEIKNGMDERERKRILWHAERSQSKERINGMLELAKSEVPIHPDDLDKDPMLLNVLNGVVDLATGGLGPHKKEHFMTRLAPVDYVPGATAPNWQKHLELIFDGSESLIQFLQVAFGYSLTGRTDADALFISWGSGANGKSFTHEIFAKVLGDYSLRTPTETLLVKQNGGIPNDVARLKGSRFVFASEADEGKRLAESLVKDLTGGDTVSARFMRAEFFDFKPTCKIWLATNHKPVVSGTDHGIWRRIRLIPFNVTIPEDQRRPRGELEEVMMKEAPGILAWAVEGCLRLVRSNFRLPIPEEVRKATLAYRGEMDLVGGFVDECCLESPGAMVGSGELYSAYLDWCRVNGENPIKQKGFTQRIDERGHQRRKSTKGVRKWYGIGLVDRSRGGQEPPDKPEEDMEEHPDKPGTDEGLPF